jgi:hypothetical protein
MILKVVPQFRELKFSDTLSVGECVSVLGWHKVTLAISETERRRGRE